MLLLPGKAFYPQYTLHVVVVALNHAVVSILVSECVCVRVCVAFPAHCIFHTININLII